MDYLIEVVKPEVGMIGHWKITDKSLVYYPYGNDGEGKRAVVPLASVLSWSDRREQE